nr:cell filamentation protein Fic [Propionibacterium sp.]
MATRFGSWESYFYPDTYDPETGQGVLRNLRGWRSADALASYEYRMTAVRQRQLDADPELIPQTLDAAQVRALHRHLFQDVYEWAGEYRTVELVKGPRGMFATVEGRPNGIEVALARASETARSTDWQSVDRKQFARAMAEVFAWTNHAHPFREGNGRTTKVFLAQIAQRSRFALDFGGVNPLGWNVLSDASRPRAGEATINPEPMAELFENLAVERPAGPSTPPVSPSPLLRASYPHSPTQSTGPQSDAGSYQRPYRPDRGYGGGGRGEGR